MRRVCIIGADGQDGSYLIKHFLKKNFIVIGVGRRKKSIISKNQAFFKYMTVDLTKTNDVRDVLKEINVETIIYCASSHGPRGFNYFDVADDTFLVNSFAPHICLNYCRETEGKCSFVFLSSVKSFDHKLHQKVGDNPWHCRNASDLYSRSKIIVENSIEFYRQIYGVNSSVVWLSNHESIKRINSNYFLPNLVKKCYQALDHGEGKINVRTLDFYCDWGCADQFMKIIAERAIRKINNDLFIGTSKFVYARDLVREFLDTLGYNYENIILEEIESNENNLVENFVFNSKWLPDEEIQNELLGPLEVLKKIYYECSSSLQ